MSKRSEGYLLIDHRESPGMPAEIVHALGLPAGAGRGLVESATYTCTHCTRIVVINPLRTRGREYCAKCDAHICDDCGREMARTGECNPLWKQIEKAEKQEAQRLILPGE